MWDHLFLLVLEVAHAPRKIHETNWRQYERVRGVEPLELVGGFVGEAQFAGRQSGIFQGEIEHEVLGVDRGPGDGGGQAREIGGFRVGYGRTREDFAGGEEVVAASLAAKLGWKIGIAPELEVEHRVVGERFTWEHVRKTVLAGTMGNYRMQRDLYIPMENISWTVRCLLSPGVDRTVGANTLLARLRHWSYRKRAWARLLRTQLRDRGRRRALARRKEPC